MKNLSQSGWESCPQGELTRLTAVLAFRRRLKIAVVAGIVLLAGAGAAGAGWLAHEALRTEVTNHESAPCQCGDPCGGKAEMPKEDESAAQKKSKAT